MGVGGSVPRPGRSLRPGKDPVHIVQGAGWTPGPVGTSAENLVPNGIRSPDRPASSQSLYRLRYPAHTHIHTHTHTHTHIYIYIYIIGIIQLSRKLLNM